MATPTNRHLACQAVAFAAASWPMAGSWSRVRADAAVARQGLRRQEAARRATESQGQPWGRGKLSLH
jgi:hypothetical protein